MKYISILGSTGSIGTQTLDVVRANMDKLKVLAITGNNNIDLLEKQIYEFSPDICAVMNEHNAMMLNKKLSHSCKTEILYGMDGLIQAATHEKSKLIVTGITGMIGLLPTVAAIKRKKDIALANKETLVAGGDFIMNLARENGVSILPIDSEHSAIFQSLVGNEHKYINKIILTASGGPFRGKDTNYLKNVTLQDALKHPTWTMGKKITIDSATLMNKGLEVIEAKYLFDIDPKKIEVVIHPESILHSGIEFTDHSTIAQLGLHDMRIPIQYALFYPERIMNSYKSLSLFDIGTLTFEKPDRKVFKCLNLAFEALRIGGTMPAVLNAANEASVALFLQGRIKFLEIGDINEKIMLSHNAVKINSIDTILETEQSVRNRIKILYQTI